MMGKGRSHRRINGIFPNAPLIYRTEVQSGTNIDMNAENFEKA
jgi:hypothetical protein